MTGGYDVVSTPGYVRVVFLYRSVHTYHNHRLPRSGPPVNHSAPAKRYRADRSVSVRLGRNAMVQCQYPLNIPLAGLTCSK